ncbi:hypothetical protein C2S51_033778 [Perilla frutescens var. frutescens]|nr:hypothetical protein C2S51_033778 [Perilla frutescens var. frutescens]
MEKSTILLAIVSIAALALISKIIENRRRWRREQKLPPGPKPWRIIGNMNLFGSIPHQSLHSLSKKYGEIMLLKLGKFPVVIASSPQMAKQFLNVHDKNFATRPALAAGKHISYNYSDMAWAPYGPYWKQARKIYLHEVFTAKRLEFFDPIRVEERCNLLSSLRSVSLTGKPVLLRPHLSRYTLSTISRMALSNKYFSKSDELEELQHMIDEWFFLAGDLVLGGTDTAATAVEWALHEILRHSGIIEKAKEELDRVIGRERWVEENDFPHLPYIDAVIMETFRLHPLATLLAPRCAIEDCNVAGYHVPKGALVMINAWSIGRDPESWESPEEFVPERFVGKEIDILGSNFAMLTFGLGRRRCPGYSLGLKLIRTTLANLLHGYDMRLMAEDAVSMEEEYGLATRPKHPISTVMRPTLPPHLY